MEGTMHERKKKDGDRKDKKMARMREAVQESHEQGHKEPHRTDQKDIVHYKSGSQGDKNQHPGPDR